MSKGGGFLALVALLLVWAVGVGSAWLMVTKPQVPQQTLQEAMLTGAAQSFAQVYEARCGVGMAKGGQYPTVKVESLPAGYEFAYADEATWSITLDADVANDVNAAVGVFVPHEVAHLAVWASFPRSFVVEPHDPAYFGAALDVITSGDSRCPNPFTPPEE